MSEPIKEAIIDEALDNAITALGQCQKGTARQFLRSAIEKAKLELRDALERSHNRLNYVKVYGKGNFDDWQEILDQNLEAMGLQSPAAQPQRSETLRKWQVFVTEDGSIALGAGSHGDRKPIIVQELPQPASGSASSEPQEQWTPRKVKNLLGHIGDYNAVADAHNAALDNADIGDSIARASKQTEDALRGQLLAAQAAIAKTRKYLSPAICKPLESVDLSALEAHDAEVRKPLVEALKRAKGCIIIKAYFKAIEHIDAALG